MKPEEIIKNKLGEIEGYNPKNITNPEVLKGFIGGLKWVLKNGV